MSKLVETFYLNGETIFRKWPNDNLRKVNDNLRNTPGSSQTVTAEAEEVCDQTAFQAGFSDEYVTTWNREIGNREMTYRFLSQSHPNDEVARHNYELYRGKTLSTKGVGNAMKYDLDMDSHGHLRNACQSSSYTQGGSAGIRAVARDLKTLSEQEIERHYE